MIIIPLFTALLVAGTFIRFPLGAMPVTLQTMVVFFIGLLLTPKEALISTLLYLFLGLIGLPVFTTGGGIAAFLAPSGGFLLAMPIATLVGSLLFRKRRDSILFNLINILIMDFILYLIGIPFLSWRLNVDLLKGFTIGFLPYLPGDIIKIIASAICAKVLYKEIEKLRSHLIEKEAS